METVERREPQTEERILEAASRVFVLRGTAGARMSEIAEEAGVNQALLHYYFRTKAELARAVFEGIARRLFPRLIEVLASSADLETKVRRVVEIELGFLLEHPMLPGYILSEVTHHPERTADFVGALTGTPVADFAPRVFGVIGSQIGEAVDAGRMRPITPENFVINLVSLCVFPFAARPLFSALTGLDEAGFAAMIEARKVELPEFFLAGMRP